VAPSQNWVYADINGNIGYQCPGLIPIRVSGHTGMVPVPGNGSYDWLGYIPFDSLPFSLNPSEGFIATANNKVPPNNYNYTILNDYDWELPYRAERIRELILAKPKLSIDDMKAIQLDQKRSLLLQISLSLALVFQMFLLICDRNYY
jgi:penicillin amidase